ncbi:MAG: M10 family metallopeptidase C-terminal domain-containing protein [Hyphomonadaceae bacterium]
MRSWLTTDRFEDLNDFSGALSHKYVGDNATLRYLAPAVDPVAIDLEETGGQAKVGFSSPLAAPVGETTLALGDDIADDTSTLANLTLGVNVNSQINNSGDQDYFKITLQAGQTYVFSMSRNGLGGIQDSYIELRDANNALVAEDDDGGIISDALLMFRPSTTGTYYVVARGFDGSATGAYTLNAQAIETGSSTVTTFAPNGKPFFSWTEAAYQLTRDGASWAASFGQSVTVTYSFRSTAPTTMPGDTGGFSRFTPVQIAAAEAALQAWAEVANINFVRVGTGTGDDAYSNNAAIVFANYSTGESGASAFATLPNSGNTSSTSAQGDIWVNVSLASNANPVVGEFGPHTLLHEIGHALGLSHPGDYDAEEGVSITYAANAEYHGDSRLFTVMSYFATTAVGGAWATYASTPQLHDIAAIQRLYGVNTATRTGDTTYGFNSNAGRPEFSITSASQVAGFTIWDGGGNDTLDLSGYSQGSSIDLRPEAFMSAGGATYNIVISRGVVIENAIGGAGNDQISGNDVANRLTGGAGNDQLLGRGGDDQLLGGLGADDLQGGSGNDSLDGGAGADTMQGGLGDDVFVVDNAGDIVTELVGEGRDTVFTSTGVVIGSELRYTLSANVEDLAVSGFAGAINLFGNALANLIVGNGAVNALDGGAGADMLIGGGGNDLYFVDNIADVIIENAGEGRDTVYTSIAYYSLGDNEIEDVVITGSAGCYVVGNALANLMVGEVGADALDGGAGADFMVGGAGNDTYFVDNIGDVLVESAGGGRDTVYVALSYYSLGDNEIEDAVVATSGGAYVIGNGLANLMVGGAGADALDGGAGADFMVGGGGNDSYFVDNLGDTVIESVGEGRDTVYASISYTLGDTEVEDLALLGSGNISAGGNGLANLLVGNGGANVLWGRGGSDTLVGGAGADRFAYMAASEGGDVITDFVSGVDKIQVSAPGFGGGLTAGGAVTLRTGASPTASGTNGQFLYNTSNGQLYWDADGTNGGAAVLLATLSGAPAISASDFVVTDGSSNPLSVGDGGIELMAMSAKDADPAPEILPAYGLDTEPLIGAVLAGKLSDGSPEILPAGTWQGEVESLADQLAHEILMQADDIHGVASLTRADIAHVGADVFDPTDFSDLAALGAAPRPEWAVIDQ